MKKYMLYPAAALAGGAVAAAVRLAQNRTGFEASTGLPVPGNLWARMLVAVLVLLGAVFFLLVRRIPARSDDPSAVFSESFSSTSVGLVSIAMAGVALLGISGVWETVSGLGLLSDGTAVPDRLHMILGVMSLLSAAGFSAVAGCRRSGAHEAAAPAAGSPSRAPFLLVPVVFCVIRLVVTYREDSIDPSLSAYYVELLALVFLTLSFYRLSSFAFFAGQSRRFLLYSMEAIVLCAAVLADPLPATPGCILPEAPWCCWALCCCVWTVCPKKDDFRQLNTNPAPIKVFSMNTGKKETGQPDGWPCFLLFWKIG